jgi:hypothetical protein
MGRRKIEVNEQNLRDTIKLVEAGGALPNLSALFNEVAEKMSLAPHVVRCRVEELKIPTLSVKGKRGRQPGAIVRDPSLVGVPRKAKLLPHVRTALLAATPTKYHYLVDRAERSSKALVHLKCLECANYQPKEVKNCGCFDCPTYSIRPYKLESEKPMRVLIAESPVLVEACS